MQTKHPAQIFCVAAPEDAAWLAQWERHLLPLQQAGHLHIWSENLLLAGEDRIQWIEHQLQQIDMIVFLLSSDFFTSAQCVALMEQALSSEQSKIVTLVPLLLRPSAWQDTPLGSLACLPPQGQPITSWSNTDEAFQACVGGIRRLLRLPHEKSTKEVPVAFFTNITTRTIVNTPEKTLPDPDRVFQFNVGLAHPSEFYGRVTERKALLQRTQTGASTSLIGARRIGKTWLLQYLRLVAAKQLGSQFRSGYVDATMPSSTTIAGFIARVLEEITGIAPKDPSTLDLATLERVVRDLRGKNQTPVLCIDEFEGLCNPQEFSERFFTGLRAIAQAGLVLVTASKRPLIKLVTREISTSPFFNIFDQRTLKPFSSADAQKFVMEKGIQARFSAEEQAYLLRFGQEISQQWPPLLLQLAGKILLEDKNRVTFDSSASYNLQDQDYQNDFERRLEERYRGVVSK